MPWSLIAVTLGMVFKNNMRLKHIIKTAVTGLRAHKVRTGLTILGIVIGIMSIMLVVSLGHGAENLIVSQIQGLGARTIAVLPGQEPQGPSDTANLFSDSLKERDLVALRNPANVPTATFVMPLMFGSGVAAYGNETFQLSVFGAGAEMAEIFSLEPVEGSFYTDEDVKSQSAVAVLGARVKEELFGADPTVGEKVRIRSTNFTVIGVLGSKGQSSFINFDDAVLTPYTTAGQYILGQKHFSRIIVEALSDETLEETAEAVRETLRTTHRIDDPTKDDFYVTTPADIANTLGTIIGALTLFLVAVAAISLVVGGVGIMNIMLVSVTERTKEIGLRKALGATRRDILLQFLAEAVIVTLLGGGIGILLGTIFAYLISLGITYGAGLAWTFSFPYGAALVGLLVSSLVGLIFGLYPAREAAKKSPMEALRYE